MSLASDTGAIVEDTNYVQLPGVYCCEVAIEKFLTNHIQDSSTTQSLVNPSMSRSLNLTEEQDKAVFNAINNKVSLFHGGAGVGKTHTVNAICLASIELGFKPLLLALSAKAVRKLEVTARGFEASTIAKAVLTGPSSFYQKRMLVIDEASMVDMLAFRNLIRNISSDSHIVLCGDFAQLPPIGFGNIFYSFIMKSNLPCQRLSVEKRQQENSGIPKFLSALRNGVLNPMQRYEFGNSDQKGIFEMNVSNQSIMAKLITLTTSLEGSYQVVSPLNGGKYGTAYLNEEFQLHKFGTLQPVVGTPLIFLKNTRLKSGDYVYNSQIATVSRVFVSSPHSLRSKYLELELEDNIRITITVSEFKELVDFAHVITVHKAQGSDWDTVICIFSRSQFVERAMVYTAISRCKTKCVCVFEDKAYTAQVIASKPSYQTRKDGLFEFKRVSGQPM